MVGAHPGSGIATEEKLQVLERVLRSDTFARSERLKSLLRYLCEAEIEGREGELNEYNIGTMALGRPADFSPLEDASVRSRTHELRQRLERYYANEDPCASVRIELRKGAYLARFVSAPAEEVVKATSAVPVLSPVELPVAQPQPPRSWGRGRNLTVGFAAGAVAMFGALAIWSAVANPGMRVPATRLATEVTPSGWTPELEALWRPFLGKKAPLLIAFETRFFVEMGPLVVRDFRVNNIGTVESSDAMMRVQRLFGVHQLYPSGDYTDVGTPVAMFYLTRLLSSRIPAIAVKSLHQMAASDFRDNNLILVGKPWMDPQIERVLAGASLVDARGKIVNVHPAPGEPAEYKDVNDRSDPDGWSEKYSVITLMPSPAGGHRILTLTGSGSENPGALAYYLTNPETVKDLYRRLYPGTAGSPEYFQILVKAQFKAKALVRVDYVTHRALKTY